jgi:hypothetical protein
MENGLLVDNRYPIVRSPDLTRCFDTSVKTRERSMGIGQMLTMPPSFASSAIYPIAIMPTWLQVASHATHSFTRLMRSAG